ncbi:domain of unknown function DUF1732 [Desulfarculus baarsii DSM 2075]|uniref:YicC domain protein n=1 Tax=Desulfarculus baarsii (strain ATCC 33931 / DSM 2075 / LMG 7858 / VKM B-1802 / 2st14) TaxID=644282 RepID=E1QIC6_DESB2|nr:YicC/YloC family endoribonuclease [Desulfarculus baarsii]ADK85443.1 domain of unknown function DUF1732 [Desulfarculus baarsii DSM 2075]
MIKSMTGYGRGQSTALDGQWIVEIRTVNSRFLDIHLRAPSGLAALEDRIKKFLAARLSRGRVSITISASGAAEPVPRLVLNRPLFKQYRQIVRELEQELGVSGNGNVWPYINCREMILTMDADPDMDVYWAQLEPAMLAALDELDAMRAAEGDSLRRDFLERLERLEGFFGQAAARSPQIVENYRQRLTERIGKLLDEGRADPERLALEVAIIADKCDITEEAVRAASHLEQFRAFLEAGEPVGRKLDFLLQELNREANTMGSKSPDAQASAMVVEMKAELERLREQVQNIE